MEKQMKNLILALIIGLFSIQPASAYELDPNDDVTAAQTKNYFNGLVKWSNSNDGQAGMAPFNALWAIAFTEWMKDAQHLDGTGVSGWDFNLVTYTGWYGNIDAKKPQGITVFDELGGTNLIMIHVILNLSNADSYYTNQLAGFQANGTSKDQHYSQVINHELGNAFGLGHDCDDSYDIMYSAECNAFGWNFLGCNQRTWTI